MKKRIAKLFSILMTLSILLSLCVPSAFAVSGNTRSYTIVNYNITAYSNSALTRRVGTIFPSDELQVLQVTSRYSKVSYPLSRGGRRTAYIPTNTILWGTGGKIVTANGRLTTYIRPGGSSYGYVAKGDRVTILGRTGDWWQIKYPVTGGYKYAMVRSGEANSVLGGQDPAPIPAPSSSSWQWPVSGYTMTQSFGHRSAAMAKKGRAYHSGVDLVNSDHIIRAAADGNVVYRGYSSGNGYHIVLSHTLNGQTVYSLYSHLSNYAGCPGKGSYVSKGQQIGTMGNTGNSTGTHLHFGVFTGYSSNPYGYTNVNSTSKMSYGGVTFYNPATVISQGRLW